MPRKEKRLRAGEIRVYDPLVAYLLQQPAANNLLHDAQERTIRLLQRFYVREWIPRELVVASVMMPGQWHAFEDIRVGCQGRVPHRQLVGNALVKLEQRGYIEKTKGENEHRWSKWWYRLTREGEGQHKMGKALL